MLAPSVAATKRIPIARLAIACGVAGVISVIALQLFGWRHAWTCTEAAYHSVMGCVVAGGPTVFFAAMAFLPALGAPSSAFSLTAGPAFGAQLGTGTVVLAGVVAVVVNLTSTYWLARRALRPLMARLLARFGYAIPTVQEGDGTDLIVVLRVTPGVPLFAQNYLLGLADVPFGRYLVISCLVQLPLNAGFILFGDALASGRGAVAITAISAVIAVAFAIHFVRKRVAKTARADVVTVPTAEP